MIIRRRSSQQQQQQPSSSPFLRKPLSVVLRENSQSEYQNSNNNKHDHRGSNSYSEQEPQESSSTTSTKLTRHLTLLDLVSIGVGGTIGSGVFVLCGLIAKEYAGPATCVSWAIAGMAAFLSGFCYAELSSKIPSAGSSYVFAYVTMGELPAFVTAAMLTLEFLVSGAAVARSWGDKVNEWYAFSSSEEGGGSSSSSSDGQQHDEQFFNPMACFVSILTCSLVFLGMKESKLVTDFFTWLKVSLVVFMIVGGLCLFDSQNVVTGGFLPFGFRGIMRGATSSFFGYLGYDGICCVGGEAMRPKRNLPLAILLTLVLVTVLYILAAFSLTGMQYYENISPESGFPEAFEARGVHWAAELTAFGEIFTLPVVVLLSSVLQPRLTYALGNDGLLPREIFCKMDQKGNLRNGIAISGTIMTLFATFVPFSYLDDFVSAGILMAFCVTNSSLLLLRLRKKEQQEQVETYHYPKSSDIAPPNNNETQQNATMTTCATDTNKEQDGNETNHCIHTATTIIEDGEENPETQRDEVVVSPSAPTSYLLEKMVLCTNILSFVAGMVIHQLDLLDTIVGRYIALLLIVLMVLVPAMILSWNFPERKPKPKKQQGEEEQQLDDCCEKNEDQQHDAKINRNNGTPNNNQQQQPQPQRPQPQQQQQQHLLCNDQNNNDTDIIPNSEVVTNNNNDETNQYCFNVTNHIINDSNKDDDSDDYNFQTPLVPYIPLFGNFVNWYLVAQLSFGGIFMLFMYIFCAIVIYFCYGAKHSIGNTIGWGEKLPITGNRTKSATTNGVNRMQRRQRGEYYNKIATTDEDGDEKRNQHRDNDFGSLHVNSRSERSSLSLMAKRRQHPPEIEMVEEARGQGILT